MTTAKKIATMQKSIALMERTKKNIEASRIACSGVDNIDTDRMLEKCNEIIVLMVNRLYAIPRREMEVKTR